MDKKSIALVVVLVAIVIFYYPILEFFGVYQPAPEGEQQPPGKDTTQVAPDLTQQETTPPSTTRADTTSDLAVVYDSVEGGMDSLPQQVDTVVIRTNKYTVTMVSFGGGPVGQVLSEYNYPDGTPIKMLNLAEEATPTATFAGETFSTSQVHFDCNMSAGTYDARSSKMTVEYTYMSPSGGSIVKRYYFYPDAYHYDLVLEVMDARAMGFERKYNLVWNTPLTPTESQEGVDYSEMQAVGMMSGSREVLDDFDDNRLNQALTGSTNWAGVREKYFTAVLIPRNRLAEGFFARGEEFERMGKNGGTVDERRVIAGIEMPFADVPRVTDSFTVFVGPLDYEVMAAYDIDLEDMLGIGSTPVVGWIIKPFALGVIWLLPRMYDVIGNYGMVIIVFAFLVKLITLPLSLKSFKSMQAMKELQPKMEEMRKKFKKDPQKLNQEMMKLYKKHGVNPMSGCLPILPQMPLFIAMFTVFRSTILLRNAPFVGFIDDLSRGAQGLTDPYIILVIIMVGAQFISQKVTMGTATQQNKAMLYIMPLFIGAIFYSVSSGLVLYWTCFSLFSLVDWALFKRGKMAQAKAKKVATSS
ncbi:membrane protein insertase YidC [candidate division GN15 bacterium]|nr:membrane protein insertase YidC [candidate division GN15 bacterium]